MLCPYGHGEKDGKFCDKCGGKLIPLPEPPPNIPFEMFGHKDCPGCGYECDHGHQHYCPGCGHELLWTCR